MYQAIPQNVSEILLKRILIFITAVLITMAIIYLYQHKGGSEVNIETSSTIIDVNKTGIAFTALDFQ